MADLTFLDFEDLLTQAISDDAAVREIHRRHGTQGTVLVVDFTGMARRTDSFGIVRALAMARAAERAMRLGGVQVKRVADTLFHLYDTPLAALNDALLAHQRLATFNAEKPDPIRACIGLGVGDLLVIPGQDIFGTEVNRAFILGEDVAKGGETLATPAFLAALGNLPDGIGAFRAPEDRETDAGFAFHVLADYRGG